MKHVTMATEKRINEMIKNQVHYSSELLYLLDEMKSRIGYMGATIKEIADAGLSIENADQINVYESNTFRRMSIPYAQYISFVFCYDLNYANIIDFNQLVKRIYESR